MSPVTAAALYTFTAHYHSGQWSRGYRLNCMARSAWERVSKVSPRLGYWEYLIDEVPDSPVTQLYYKMVEAWGERV